MLKKQKSYLIFAILKKKKKNPFIFAEIDLIMIHFVPNGMIKTTSFHLYL